MYTVVVVLGYVSLFIFHRACCIITPLIHFGSEYDSVIGPRTTGSLLSLKCRNPGKWGLCLLMPGGLIRAKRVNALIAYARMHMFHITSNVPLSALTLVLCNVQLELQEDLS